MTKKELAKIVDGITAGVLLRLTEGQGDNYEPTSSEEDEARTLVGIALKRNRTAILAAIPVFAPMMEAAPVAAAVEPVSTLILS